MAFNILQEEREVIKRLNDNWVWTPHWVDSSESNTAGSLVKFFRHISLKSNPRNAVLNISADTRYKLIVNGRRVAVGPSRSTPQIWFYDNIDIAPYLQTGTNSLEVIVLRYFNATRLAMPFMRTAFPGLTIHGKVEANDGDTANLDSASPDWRARVDLSVEFPSGLIGDGFLHINERVEPSITSPDECPKPHNMKTLNGDLLPWRLRQRMIPMPQESPVSFVEVKIHESSAPSEAWMRLFSNRQKLILPPNSKSILDIQAEVHSTAFLRWSFLSQEKSRITLKAAYSEGYELEPRSYPFFRSKENRLDSANGHLLGPYDQAVIDLPAGKTVTYEPFWFRTFRLIRLEIITEGSAVDVVEVNATQTNYPLDVKASFEQPSDPGSERIWDVSIRTLRNCMFDGYSDCPFYEQLQYSGDSRSVGLFHYLLSGDDRLMRQTITIFAASTTYEGLTQSRYPSHVNQLIAGFSLYWVLQVCDHHLYFGDTAFSRSFLPRIDGVLEFFNSYVDEKGLVSGLPDDLWQFVDWVTTWGATDDFPDKGVPTSGRKNNLHTYFSMLYAYVLRQTATLLRHVKRPAHCEEYEARADALCEAVRRHCYDGSFFTDSLASVANNQSYSQHCQAFAVLCGACPARDQARILQQSFDVHKFSKCSYMMVFYLLRACSIAGEEVYESIYSTVWEPWKKMLENNLTTWEEDDVRQRSDCHAWGSVPIYEYCVEFAGIHVVEPGCSKILWRPRLHLSPEVKVQVALGSDNVATVSWKTIEPGQKVASLKLARAIDVAVQLPGGRTEVHGLIDKIELNV